MSAASPATAGPGGPAGRSDRFLGWVERTGNRLPDPFVLFLGLFVLVALVSTAAALADVQVTVPGADEPVVVRGLFTGEGLTWLTTNLGANFIGFPPLLTVLTILLAVGVAERSGLLGAVVRLAFHSAPPWALPYVVGVVGVTASVMSDTAFVVVPPLAAMVFRAAGRHPVAGLLGGFAAAGAGYSTNFLVTSLDALFAGITNATAAVLPDPGTTVTPVSNLFFNVVSAAVLSVITGLVITRVLEPRLERIGVPRERQAEEADEGVVGGAGGAEDAPVDVEEGQDLTPEERRSVRRAGVAALVTAVVMLVAVLLPGSPWRGEGGGYLPESPLLDSVVFIVFTMFLVPGLVYGRSVGTLRTGADVPRFMVGAVRDLAPFVALAFVLGNFIALFTWSGVGTWLAVSGAGALEDLGLTGYPVVLLFVLLASLLNLVIISGSSLWALMAAVFVPLFALLGFEPAFTQAAFRVGDSATQVLTPLNPYMIVLLTMLRRYEPQAGLGSIISRMLPFSVTFWLAWVAVLTLFYVTGTPLGPGAGIRLDG
ncbi:AbgT family transporter [Pseudokineococcus lusitanus]|uniref:Aminobenzoyl-glutamate transport protein n=1 Tax=Pseudokineococcus lusitanus TaxID=763993 RepID=A0A3N1HMS2_9ACTN|nr:AbgT family transporter [Pseudokineococcus lusitanus]ROP43771.1 aminobenzoyl-glutamate transport protein [Pseudokineococcus lusitanus]